MTTRPGYAGTTTNLQIVLNTPKNPYLNQVTQKNTCQIFLPKNSWNRKISSPKKSFNHPRRLKSGVPPPPPPRLLIINFVITLSNLSSQTSLFQIYLSKRETNSPPFC